MKAVTDEPSVRLLAPIRRLDVFAWGIAHIPHLAAFVPEVARVSWRPFPGVGTSTIAGWGYRPTSRPARYWSRWCGVPYWALEDGFMRSVGLGSQRAPPMSLVVDDVGIYYDATRPSRIENMLNGEAAFPKNLLDRARGLVAFKNEHALSKYNTSPRLKPGDLPPLRAGQERVLLVDQMPGDISIRYGLADENSFQAMAKEASQAHPKAQLLVRRHPGAKPGRGGLVDLSRFGDRLVPLRAPMNPIDLLRSVDRVYTVSSLMGFEAMLLGKPVHCFGMPFYAGWGATLDALTCVRRMARRSVEEIAAAALLLYPRYVDPLTGRPSSPEQVAERLVAFRARADANRGHWSFAGIAFWKRAPLRQHFGGPSSTVSFHRTLDQAVARGGRPVLWSARERPHHAETMAKHGVLRLEDGFVRSVGLGSDFHGAASVVLDDGGIYYDPASGSRLERILAETEFEPALLTRAAALRTLIVAGSVSKYNIGGLTAPARPAEGRVVLVVGQVEGDASIRRGGMVRNDELVRAVRAREPEAFLLYKEHPDVVAGNRDGRLTAEGARLVDGRADRLGIHACFGIVDQVHTLTSLAGFEALLAGLSVTVYGQPFYAGWGLTQDLAPVAHRTRRLSLDALVAGALILYPRYVDPRTGLPCEAEWAEAQAAGAGMRGPDGIWAARRYARAVRYGVRPPVNIRLY